MPVCFVDILDRRWIQFRSDLYWVFGDNLLKTGHGGQAGACRGEPNVIGIPTKKRPDMKPDAFFDNPSYAVMMVPAFAEIQFKLMDGETIVVPTAGVGSGLAKIPEKSPELYEWIREQFKGMVKDYGRLRPEEAGLSQLMRRSAG